MPAVVGGWSTLQVSRSVLIALAVVALHGGMLVLFQSGLLMRTAEVLVPVEVLARLMEPPVVVRPTPVVEPPRPVAKAPTAPVAKPITPRTEAKPEKPLLVAPLPPPMLLPQAVTELSPTPPVPNAPTAQPAPPPPAPVVAAPAVPSAQSAAPSIQLPSSNADYLQNPEPKYPENSQRLNEQGTSTIRVLIGADGLPQRAEIGQSSGFDRLDRAALATVMRWRYVPGKRNGVSEAMWVSVPIVWKLTTQ